MRTRVPRSDGEKNMGEILEHGWEWDLETCYGEDEGDTGGSGNGGDTEW